MMYFSFTDDSSLKNLATIENLTLRKSNDKWQAHRAYHVVIKMRKAHCAIPKFKDKKEDAKNSTTNYSSTDKHKLKPESTCFIDFTQK